MGRLHDIATLVRAGMTLQQIADMEANEAKKAAAQTPAQQPAQQAAQQPAQQPAQQAEQKPAQQPAQAPASMDDWEKLMMRVFEKAAIGGSNQPAADTADDICARIIDPDYKKEE